MINSRKKVVEKIAFSSLIASIYTICTVLLAPISYGAVQVRVSEALTILPYFSAYPIGGLFIGCLISNLIGGNGLLDIIFGSLATLVAGILTYIIGRSNLKYKKYICPLPPVVINAVVVGFVLNYTLNLPLLPSMFWVGIGEAIACYILGLLLLSLFEKNKKLKKYIED